MSIIQRNLFLVVPAYQLCIIVPSYETSDPLTYSDVVRLVVSYLHDALVRGAGGNSSSHRVQNASGTIGWRWDDIITITVCEDRQRAVLLCKVCTDIFAQYVCWGECTCE